MSVKLRPVGTGETLKAIALSAMALFGPLACSDGDSVWRSPSGVEVREYAGSDHCEWASVRFLRVPDSVFESAGIDVDEPYYDLYAKDEAGLLRPEWLSGQFSVSGQLPRDASPTGHEDGSRKLFVSPAEHTRAVFVQNGDTVERWPRFNTGCD